ncbi:cysteine methyltransferase [Saccharospirillum sp. MSK14-1]|uniref:methylated-DNA--[protein]-cysteine S-methyltransferase n=1 Tax=Saccharospirillum sp. MSK14-1 TaxID=1897632 RepID=UPI000D38DC17|nr:methylated-DNA--[protein]-cysteine S-methyltransferase [Saccharospirillum sp. MSK14-1]PTY37753.1 cysteine methyltransferase [Saccharospirillum sp. MSK14-1]
MAAYQQLSTPLGEMMAVATDRGLFLLEFTDPQRLERQLPALERYLGEPLQADSERALFATVQQQLDAYFAKELRRFEIPLDLQGSEFQRQAWSALLAIPYGQTRSYQQQAQAIDRPQSVRAVARANGDNRIAIVVPCHRVIGKDGTLTGYGGGLWRKQKLLALEGAVAQPGLFDD